MKDLLSDFSNYLARMGLNKNSIRNYRVDFSQFIEYVRSLFGEIQHLSDITPDAYQSFLLQLETRNVDPVRIRRYKAMMKHVQAMVHDPDPPPDDITARSEHTRKRKFLPLGVISFFSRPQNKWRLAGLSALAGFVLVLLLGSFSDRVSTSYISTSYNAFDSYKNNTSESSQENSPLSIADEVLAARTTKTLLEVRTDVQIDGLLTALAGVNTQGSELDLGGGVVTNASNVTTDAITIAGVISEQNIIYGLTAGDGIAITGGQTPTISSNQLSFGGVTVGGTTIAADNTADTITFAGSGNVSLSASGDVITISATDTDTNTTYTAGTDLDLSGTVFSLEPVLDSVTSINFSDGGFLDFSAITHNDSAAQGIKLPQADSFTNLSDTDGGYLVWDTNDGKLQQWDGTQWEDIATGGTTLWTDQGAYISADNATNVVITDTGNIGIATTNPTQKLHVQGNARITGALYDGNNEAGTAGQLLTSTGSSLDWISTSSINFWQRVNSNTLAPLTDTDNFAIGSTLTAGALFYIPGTTNNNGWVNLGTGKFGIGTTNPSATLDVGGAFTVTSAGAAAFTDGGFLDLAAITHNDTALQGLRLPQNTTAGLSAPSSGEGFIAWSTDENKFKQFDGSSWADIATGGSTEWTLVGTVVAPNTEATTNVAIGGTSSTDADIYLAANGAAVFNEQGASVDFRIEGDTNTSLFFVDGSADAIGIGTSLPGSKLSLSGGLAIGTTSPSSTYLTKLAPDGGVIIEGNVGIGTTNPGAKLEVGGNILFSAGSNRTISIADGTSTQTFSISGGRNISGTGGDVSITGGLGDSTDGGKILLNGGAGLGGFGGDIRINGGNGPSGVGHIILGNTLGNIGIGTTAPIYKLDVNGSARIGTTAVIGAGVSLNGDYISDFTGTGLTITSGALSVTGFDNYQSWTASANVGTTNVTSGATLTIAGGTGIGTSLTGGTITIINTGDTSATNELQNLWRTIAGDTGSTAASSQTDTLTIAGGAGIATSMVSGTLTTIFQSTELGNLTWGDGATAYAWTFNGSGGTDPVLYYGNNYLGLTTGNLGIGTTVPGSKLTVSGGLAIGTTSVSSTYLTKLAPDGGAIFEGNVGIGTTTPSYKLDVNGAVNIGTTAVIGSGVSLNGDYISDFTGTGLTVSSGALSINLSGTYVESFGTTLPSGAVIFSNGSRLADDLQNFYWDDSSNELGIGTTTPDRKLDVLDASNPQLRLTQADNSVYADFQVASTGDLVIGVDGTTSQFVLDNGGSIGIGTTAPGYKLDVVSADTTGLLGLTGDSITTGTGINVSLDSLTSGVGMLLEVNGSTSFSGDILKINLGAGTSAPTGNLFALYNNNSELFSVDTAKITSAVPHEFTASGDVSIANDLQFTNQTAATIKSLGPLSIESGQSFENLNLTLTTFGTGDLVANLGDSGSFNLVSADPTIFFDTLTATDTDFWIGVQEDAGADDDDKLMIGDGIVAGTNPFITIQTNGNVGIGTTTPAFKLDVEGSIGATSIRLDADSEAITDFTGTGLTITSGALSVTGFDNYQSWTASANVGTTNVTSGATLTIAGGTGIGTSLTGGTITIINTGDTSATNELQNLWRTIAGDTGSTAASSQTDTLTIAGGAGIATSMVSGTLTTIFQSTELSDLTWGSGSPFTWTLNAGATDPAIAFGNNYINISSGNLGIGTTAPSAALDIAGNVTVTSGGAITVADGGFLDLGAITHNDTALQGLRLPQNTTAGLSAPSSGEGFLAWSTNENKFKQFDGSVWADIATGGSTEWTLISNDLAPNTEATTNVAIGGTASTDADIYLAANGAAVFNEQGGSVDFRIEGDTNTSLFFVDGSADAIGIGTTAPAFKLDVEGSIGATSIRLDADSEAITDFTGTGLTISGGALSINLSGTYVESFGTTLPSGAVIFSNGTRLADDLQNFYWDDSSNELGIGTTTPDRKLDILDASNPQLRLTQADNSVYADFQVASTGDLVIGVDGTTSQFVLDNGGSIGIGTTAPGYKLDIVSGDTTGLLGLTGDSITTGTGINVSLDSLTSGVGMLLEVNGSTSLSGDIFKINIGAGTSGPTGNLLALYNNNSELFSVDTAKITSAVPHEFTASGDVSIANDLQFTNQTAATIKSLGPLSIESGQSFENLNLTLTTFGTGDLVANLGDSGSFNLVSADPTIFFDTLTATDTDFWIGVQEDAGGDDDDKLMIGDGTVAGTNPFMTIQTNGNVGIGTTAPGFKLDVEGSIGATSIRLDADSEAITDFTGTGLTITSGALSVTGFDNYQSWTASANVGTTNVTSGATLTIAGGTGIGTSLTGGTITIINTGDTSATNELQNLWRTVAGDTGSTAASSQTDTLTIAGGAGIATSMVSGTLTSIFQSTELTDLTWGSGSPFTWTLNAGATDPAIAFGNNYINISSGNLGIGTTAPSAALDIIGDQEISGGLSVGFAGDGTDDRIYVGDATYFLDYNNVIAGSPIINFDTNDYLEYNRTDNRFSFFVGGNEEARVNAVGVLTDVVRDLTGNLSLQDDGGNVGVGTTSPTATFHIAVGATNIVGQKITLASAATANALEVNTSSGVGGNLLALLSSGNLGIGTTNPAFKLDVEGSIGATSIRLDADSEAITDFTGTGLTISGGALSINLSGTYVESFGTTMPSGAVIFSNGTRLTEDLQSFYWDDSSNELGIGTTTPDRKLDILDASNPQLRLTQADNSVYADFQVASTGDLVVGVDGTTSQFVLDNGGNIGIGTTAPTTALDVVGSLQVQSGNIAITDGTSYGIGAVAGQPLQLVAGGQQRIYITSSGNVGIGTTAAASQFAITSTGLGTTQPQITLTRNAAGRWITFADGTDNWGLYNTAGSPEAALIADTGALSMDTTNGTLYVKTDDGDATGWVNLATGATSPWTDLGSIIYPTSYENIGVGTSLAGSELTVSGGLAIGTTSVSSTYLSKLAPDGGAIFEGNVGIGTTTPGAKLNVVGTGTTTAFSFLTQDSAGTRRFAILDNGNVGVGVTAPGSKVSVSGGLSIGTTSPTSQYHTKLAPDGGAIFEGAVAIGRTAPTSGYIFDVLGQLYLDNPSTYNITINAANNQLGQIGNGQVLSNTEFGLYEGAGNTPLAIYNSATQRFHYGTSGVLSISSNNNVGIGTSTTSALGKLHIRGAGTTTGFSFLTEDSGSTRRFAILDNGNVGIGTTAPGGTLDIGQSVTAASAGTYYSEKINNSYTGTMSTGTPVTSIYSLYNRPNIGIGGTSPQLSNLFIDYVAGNIGIGTTTVVTNLYNMYVAAPTTNTGSSVTNSYAFVSEAGAGNVGIGTTAPTAALDIAGTVTVTSAGALTIADGGFLDLGAIIHNDTALQGLRLPQNTTAGLSAPSSGEGFLAWSTNENKFKQFDGSSWADIATGGSTEWTLISNDLAPNTEATTNVAIGGTASTDADIYLAANGAAVFNEQGASVDFRIEGDTNTSLFFVDGSADAIGIGTTLPGSKLSISGGLAIGTTSASSTYLTKLAPDGGAIFEGNVGIGTTNPTQKLYLVGAGATFQTTTTASEDFIMLFNATTSGGSVNNVSRFYADAGTGVANSLFGVQMIDSDGGGWDDGFAFRPSPAGDDFTYVGIGTTLPQARLHVVGNNTTSAVFMNGNVGIATTAPGSRLSISGGLAIGTTSVSSTYLSKLAPDGGALFEGLVGIGTTAPTFKLDVVSSNTTGLLNLTGDSITSGTGINVSLDGLTSGVGMLLETNGSTSFSGDIFKINIGAGTSSPTGNLLALYNNGTELFSVDTTKITSAVPHEFTASGDVSIANDLQFTNQTAATIKSKGPLTIESGEVFENLDLTLKPSGSGAVVIDDGSDLELYTAQKIVLDTDESGDTYFYFDTTNDYIRFYVDGVESVRITDQTTGAGSLQTNDAIDTAADFDIAETYPTFDETLRPGDIVMIDSENPSEIPAVITKAVNNASEKQLGIVSTSPAYTMGAGSFAGEFCSDVIERGVDIVVEDYENNLTLKLAENESTPSAALSLESPESTSSAYDVTRATVAERSISFRSKAEGCLAAKQALVTLAGRIPAKVSIENGDIEPGDYLTISNTAGVAMKATKPGYTVAKALEHFTAEDAGENGTGVIMAYANLSYYPGENGSVLGAIDTSTDNLDSSELADILKDLTVEGNSKLFGDLHVLGDTTLSDTSITGDLTVGLLKVDGLVPSLSSVGTDLKLQTSPLSGNLDIFNGKIVMTTDGSVKVAETITAKQYSVDVSEPESASLGSETLPQGETSITIETTAVREDSAIFVTAKTLISTPLVVTQKVAGESFTVSVAGVQSEDVEFDWWIVQKE